MAATHIDGRAIARAVREELRGEIETWVSAGGGRPGLVPVPVGDDSASAVGATDIDFGITGGENGLVRGVSFTSTSKIARLITPAPGEVAPMTIAVLLCNTLEAAQAQQARVTAA